MRPGPFLLSIPLLLVLPLRSLAQVGCTDPELCRPGATVPVTVTILHAENATRSLDFDYTVFGIGVEDRADLFPVVTIDGTRRSGPIRRGDDDPEWNWATTVDVSAALDEVEIIVELWEADPVSPNDPVDISSNIAANEVIFRFDLCSGEISRPDVLGGPVVGRSGSSFNVGGDDRDTFDAGDRADLTLKIETPTLVPRASLCDLQVTAVDLVQTVRDVDLVVPERPAVMRVRVSSTFDSDITTEVECHVNDFVGPVVVRRYPITIPACGGDRATAVVDTFFLVDAPPTIRRGGNLVVYGAIIDPDGIYHTPDMPECMIINDGSGQYDRKDVRTSRPLSLRVTRYSHSRLEGADEITVAEMDNAADSLQRWVERLFPARLPIEVSRDEDVTFLFPFPLFTGPWSEVSHWSVLFYVTGEEPTIGLVADGWLDAQPYKVFPDGRTGSSLGKLAPRFAIAEIGTNREITPAHELGHTMGLSGEPCDGDFIAALWDCEDEYNTDDFPDGPFMGSGYDFFDPAPGPVTGTCLMDNDAPQWISANDYMGLLTALEGQADPRILIVSGYVDARGEGRLEAAYGLAEGTADRIVRDGSPFTLVILDDARAVLGEYGLLPRLPSGVTEDNDGPDRIPGAIDQDGDCVPDPLDEDGDGVQDSLDDDGLPDGDQDMNCIPDCFPLPHVSACRDTMWFTLAVPWPANGVAVELRGPSGGVIDGLPVDEIPVPIELAEPLGPVEVGPHEPVLVRWVIGGGAARDEAPGRVTQPPAGVLVAASYDGGKSWFPRAVVEDGNQYVLPNDRLQRRVSMLVRVYALQNGLVSSSTAAPPTATRLAAFRATPGPAGVVLTWTVHDPAGIAGYHLDRTDAQGERGRLNPSTIPARPAGVEQRFLDESAVPGARYAYTLSGALAGGGEVHLGQVFLVVPGPLRLGLERPAPNPTGRLAVVRYATPRPGAVHLAIFDAGGRLIRRLVDGVQEAGDHEVGWDLRDESGHEVHAGLYFVRLEVDGRRLVHRMAVVR